MGLLALRNYCDETFHEDFAGRVIGSQPKKKGVNHFYLTVRSVPILQNISSDWLVCLLTALPSVYLALRNCTVHSENRVPLQ